MGTSICASVFGRVENPSSAALKKLLFSLVGLFVRLVGFFLSLRPRMMIKWSPSKVKPNAGSDSCVGRCTCWRCFRGNDRKELFSPLVCFLARFSLHAASSTVEITNWFLSLLDINKTLFLVSQLANWFYFSQNDIYFRLVNCYRLWL